MKLHQIQTRRNPNQIANYGVIMKPNEPEERFLSLFGQYNINFNEKVRSTTEYYKKTHQKRRI